MLKIITLIVVLAVSAQSLSLVKRQAGDGSSETGSRPTNSLAYVFADGIEDILPEEVKETFACDDRPYGFYADVDNDCRVFHVCLPIPEDEAGKRKAEVLQYSFFCPNQTKFDQESLVCAHDEFAFPCDQAPSLYDEINSRFGVVDPSSAALAPSAGGSRSQSQRSAPAAAPAAAAAARSNIVEKESDAGDDDVTTAATE